MAKFRSIQTSFWSDSKVVDDFTPEDRFFYLYLLTNEKSNQLGCYEISINQMCRDTGYNSETIKALLNRFQFSLKLIEYDEETKEIFIKNWHKYNWFESENTKKCIDNEFSLVKSDKLKESISPLYTPYIPHTSNKKKKKKNNKKNNNKKNKNNTEKNIYSYLENNFGITINGTNLEKIEELLLLFDDEILCYAVDRCVASNKTNLNYFFGILKNWKTSGYKTFEEIKENDIKPEKVEEEIPARRIF